MTDSVLGFLVGTVEGFLFMPCLLLIPPPIADRLRATGIELIRRLANAIGILAAVAALFVLFLVTVVIQRHVANPIAFGRPSVGGLFAGGVLFVVAVNVLVRHTHGRG